MIRLYPPRLSGRTLAALKKYQQEIDLLPDHKEQVAKAKESWKTKTRDKPFEEVKEKLTEMCAGARRCCYCEDSVADEIEHIYPKTRFPDKTFVWDNYLYAYGSCNRPKSNDFAIFDAKGNPINLASLDPNLPPPIGLPLLINPREEDPFDYLILDLSGTFFFVPIIFDKSDIIHKRGNYSITLLKLNRDDIAKGRKEAYGDYRARLREYIIRRDGGATKKEKDELIEGIKTKQHPAVWEEMKRQHKQIGELEALFDAAPEALAW
ncbi:MAG: hypothetical protein AAGI38_08400 [Bacteroidota bacterium]